MMRLQLVSLLLLIGPARLQNFEHNGDIDYESLLNDLWDQTDNDPQDGQLSFSEFEVAWNKLGIPTSILTSHSQDLQTFFDDLDSNDDGYLTQRELADAVNNHEDYRDDLISAFTNGAGEVPENLLEPVQGILEADARVELSLTIAGPPSEIYPGQRQQIVSYFADLLGVGEWALIVTFLSAETSGRRALQAEVMTSVEVTAFLPDAEAAADAAAIAADLSGDSLSGATAFAGLVVDSFNGASAVTPESLNVNDAVLYAAILLVLMLFLCAITCCYSRAKGAKCCCEPFASVKAWMTNASTYGVILIVASIMLYLEMTEVVDSMVGIVESILEFTRSTSTYLSDFNSNVPPQLTDFLEQYRTQLELAPFAVIAPATLCGVLMIVASCCPALKCVDDRCRCCCRRGSYTCSKCFSFFALLLLLVSFALYLVIAAVGVIVHNPALLGYSVEETFDENVGSITGLCLTVPPTLKQLVSDNKLAVEQLEAAGQDVAEYQQALEEISVLVLTVDNGCDHMQAFFPAVVRLFVPCVTCVAAILCSLFLTCSLCCSTGCFKNPPTAPVSNSDGGATWTSTPSNDQYSSTKNPFGEGLARA